MDNCRLRVKIGPYEMEAEGPRDFVEKHYDSFADKIPQSSQLATLPQPEPQSQNNEPRLAESEFSTIFKVEGKFVTLTAKPGGEDQELDGLLLVLLGYKEMRGIDVASADELIYGMRQSGFSLPRADRLAGRAEGEGLITITGVRRGTRYRLTNPGAEKAKKIAREMVALL